MYELGYLLEVLLIQPPRGHRGCSNTNTAGNHGTLITRDGVLVCGDIYRLQDGFYSRPVDTLSRYYGQSPYRVQGRLKETNKFAQIH